MILHLWPHADLQVFLVHRIVLIPRQAPETAFLPAGGQKRVVSTVVIDHVRVPSSDEVGKELHDALGECHFRPRVVPRKVTEPVH